MPPWLEPYRGLLAVLGGDPWSEPPAAWMARCNAYAVSQALPLQFVAAERRREAALSYERRITESGQIASRANLHDAVNALVWLRFARSKATLSRLHFVHGDHVGPGRGPRRDALTLFDEHGALLLTRHERWLDALAARAWETLFRDDPAGFRTECQVVLFGHGLLARMPHAHDELTANTVGMLCPQGPWPMADLDRRVAHAIAQLASPAQLLPMPVLGIPGWRAGQDAQFYATRRVFRPASWSGVPTDPG